MRIITVTSVFHENKYYPQVYLHKCLYECEYEYEDDYYCVV